METVKVVPKGLFGRGSFSKFPDLSILKFSDTFGLFLRFFDTNFNFFLLGTYLLSTYKDYGGIFPFHPSVSALANGAVAVEEKGQAL